MHRLGLIMSGDEHLLAAHQCCRLCAFLVSSFPPKLMHTFLCFHVIALVQTSLCHEILDFKPVTVKMKYWSVCLSQNFQIWVLEVSCLNSSSLILKKCSALGAFIDFRWICGCSALLRVRPLPFRYLHINLGGSLGTLVQIFKSFSIIPFTYIMIVLWLSEHYLEA